MESQTDDNQFCNLLCMEIFTSIKEQTIRRIGDFDFSSLKNLNEDEKTILKKELHFEFESFFADIIRSIKEEHYKYNVCNIKLAKSKITDAPIFKCKKKNME